MKVIVDLSKLSSEIEKPSCGLLWCDDNTIVFVTNDMITEIPDEGSEEDE